MHYLIWDPVQWLVQWLVLHVVLIKHWFNNLKRKQNDSSSVNQQSRSKRKARASLSVKRGFNLQTQHMLTEVSLPAYIEDEWFTLLLSLIQHYNVMFVTDWNRLNGEQMAMLLWYQQFGHLCHLLHLLCPQWPANKAHTTICWVCCHSEQEIPARIQLKSNFVHLN